MLYVAEGGKVPFWMFRLILNCGTELVCSPEPSAVDCSQFGGRMRVHTAFNFAAKRWIACSQMHLSHFRLHRGDSPALISTKTKDVSVGRTNE
jgi:hypothetical protein